MKKRFLKWEKKIFFSIENYQPDIILKTMF